MCRISPSSPGSLLSTLRSTLHRRSVAQSLSLQSPVTSRQSPVGSRHSHLTPHTSLLIPHTSVSSLLALRSALYALRSTLNTLLQAENQRYAYVVSPQYYHAISHPLSRHIWDDDHEPQAEVKIHGQWSIVHPF